MARGLSPLLPATRTGPLALARRGAAALAVAASGVALAACGGSSAGALVRTACHDVARSIATYEASLGDGSASARHGAQVAASDQLRAGLAPAALAASSDGRWQALMTTISESATVPEAYLIPALRAQCAAGAAG